MNKSIIVPIAADKPEYETVLPYLFRLDKHGFMPCITAISGLNLADFDKIYFTVLKKHCDLFLLRELFKVQFQRLKIESVAELVELDIPTKNQPETVYKTIRCKNIKGMIFVKDADSYFSANIIPENSVCVYPLDNLSSVNPQNKSYVNIDDLYYITNIIEKRILGRDFCAGGYCFESVDDFNKTFEILQHKTHLYMSHLIYKLLLNRNMFRPVIVNDYRDWGTEKDWKNDED